MDINAWNDLSGKAKWDVMVALRGPDVVNVAPAVKWFTTAVIRGEMRDIIRTGGLINTTFRACVFPRTFINPSYKPLMEAGLANALIWDSEHFFDHVRAACGYLKIPYTSVPTKKFWEVTRGTTYGNPTANMAEYVEDPTIKALILKGVENAQY